MVAVAGEVDVVNPHVRGGLDADSVSSGGEDLGDLEVAEDDVLLVQDAHADSIERYGRRMSGIDQHVGKERRPTGSSSAEERGVRTDPDDGVTSDVAVEDNDLGVVPGGGGDEVAKAAGLITEISG